MKPMQNNDVESAPHVAVLGAGAFGTALACMFADCGVDVALWCHDHDVARDVQHTRINQRYMQDIRLADCIQPHTSLEDVLSGASLVVVATPVKFLRSVLEQARPWYQSNQVWVMASKGVETTTLMLPTQIVEDVFQQDVVQAVIMGPSFAKELVAKQPTQFVVAAEHLEVALVISQLLQAPYISTVISSDTIGVQLCAAYKNVVALAAGILDGAGYQENVRALLITVALAEMQSLIESAGGLSETVMSAAGVGDLVLTAYSTHSRNFRVGRSIGQGHSREEALADTGATAEGLNTVESLYALSSDTQIALPLCSLVYNLVHGTQKPSALVNFLLAKE